MAIASSLSRTSLVLALVLATLGVGAGAAAEEWAYTVRPGDEIWNIASRYCGSPAFAARIIEFNQLADERRLRPGTRLRIPVDWLVKEPITAELLTVRGDATLFTPEPEVARAGREIEMGYRLATAEGSAVVGFADGSSLVLHEQTEVLFNVLTAFGDSGMVDTNLRFYRGRGTSRVIRRNDASRFRISSPAGTAAVRGTEFRVAIVGEASLTETLEGEVGFLRDVETAVPAGFGLAASAATVLREELLAAPRWRSPPGPYAPGAELSWEALAGARAYRVTVYAAADPQAPLRSSVTASTSVALEALAPGSYLVAVRGISTSELEGYDGTLAVDLGTAPPQPTAPAVLTAGSVRLSWSPTATGAPYVVEVAGDPAAGESVSETATGLELLVPLGPGRYQWRVRDATSPFSAPTPLTVRPASPSVPEVTRRGRTVDLTWTSPHSATHRLVVSRNADLSDPVLEATTTEPAYSATLPGVGNYHVQVVAVAEGVESEPAATTFEVTDPPPWWLLGILLLPIFL